jgi:hypothetical protein
LPIAFSVSQPNNIPHFSQVFAPPYAPQQYQTIIPPVPSAAELEERINTRMWSSVHFALLKKVGSSSNPTCAHSSLPC